MLQTHMTGSNTKIELAAARQCELLLGFVTYSGVQILMIRSNPTQNYPKLMELICNGWRSGWSPNLPRFLASLVRCQFALGS